MILQACVFSGLASIPFLGFLAFSGHREEFLVGYEVLVAVTSAIYLLVLARRATDREQRLKLRWLGLAMGSVAAGESICGINFLRDNIGARGQTQAELLYVGFWAVIVGLMRWHFGPIIETWRWRDGFFITLIVSVVIWTQVRFIFPESGIFEMTKLSAIYMMCWLSLKGVAVILAMAHSTRANRIEEFIFLQSIVALFCTGLSSAYQAVADGHGSLYWFETSWAVGLCGILCAASVTPKSGRKLCGGPHFSDRGV